jgi:two-component system, OmpR family, sensor kinase
MSRDEMGVKGGPADPPAYSWLQRRSLRWRVVALVVGLLLVGCLIVGGVTTLALQSFLTQRLDQQVAAAAERYSVALGGGDGDADEQLFASAAGQPTGTFGARVLAGHVTAVGVVTGRNVALRPSAADQVELAALHAADTPRTVTLPSLGGEYRVLAVALGDGDVLVTGLPERSIDDTIARLVVIEALVFAAALLVTGALSAVGVRVALRPLNRVATTARRVAGLALATGDVALTDRVPPAPLSTEVGKVAEAFNLMLHHVEDSLMQRQASEDRLRTFVADASHELRTPIAVIRSHIEYIQRGHVELPDDVDQALRRAAAEAERSGQLVDDLLLLARLDSGRPLDDGDVDLTRVVMDAVNDAHRVDPERRWQLDLAEVPVVVRGDEYRLHQAVANLLANASLHTPPGTTVTTHLSRDPGRDRASVVVDDDGPGISEGMQPHVFDRFAQADPRNGHDSGLGLSIVEAIARAHSGAVAVRSRPGRTEFTLTVPLHPSGEQVELTPDRRNART